MNLGLPLPLPAPAFPLWLVSAFLPAADSGSMDANVAREGIGGWGALFDLPAAQEEQAAPAAEPAQASHKPRSQFELSISDQSFWVAVLFPINTNDDYFSLELLGNEDNDFVLDAWLMRFGSPEGTSLSFGIGAAFYAVFVDTPDQDAYAIALAGAARYGFDTSLPISLGMSLAVAPDVTTFDDGDGLFDFWIDGDVEISDWASAFVGFRFLQVDLDVGGHFEVDDQLHVGIRMAL